MTKKLAEARAGIIILFTLAAAVLWFVPEFTVHKEIVKSVDFKFMGITLFAIPIMVSRVISFIVWLSIAMSLIPCLLAIYFTDKEEKPTKKRNTKNI